jgi:ankyrin repeat protein
MSDPGDPTAAFIEAACVPMGSGHRSGTLDAAEAIRAAHPDLASRSIHAASVLGDEVAVRGFLDRDVRNATATGGPRAWDALTHLCFSRYLRLDRTRAAGFVRAAAALLDAGASANTGFFEKDHRPEAEWESVLYGAAGVAHDAELTRLLLDRGADPNDNEVPYHAPESSDNQALMVLVESERLTEDSLATILLRKADWHDHDAVRWLLERGVDPNRVTRWGRTALHQAVLRDNVLETIALMVEHGADPTLLADGRSTVSIAARRGRGDVLELFARRGVRTDLDPLGHLIAACARNDVERIHSITVDTPHAVEALLAEGGTLLAEFAGNGNTGGVGHLLDLGVKVTASYPGDAYFGIAADSTALHVAAWRARHDTVRHLIGRGAPVDAPDSRGQTPLSLAVRACVASYWTHRRSPESVAALLDAGASASGVEFPSGYAEVDALLANHAKREDRR